MLLSIGILAAMLPSALGASADTTVVNTWTSGDTTVTLYDDGSLVVSGTGDMADYGTSTSTRAPWLASSTYYSAIKSLTIEEGVTHVGDCITNGSSSSNYSATNIESVTIASTVTSIGDRFLRYCSDVTSITIPDSVTSIGTYFLANYTGSGLSVTVPDSVTSIGSNAFYNSTGITSVTLSNSVTTINSSFLYNCTGITSFTLPESVTTIEGSFLYGCTGITSFTLPITVTSVGANFLQGCTSLTSLTIEVDEEGNAGFDTINGSFLSGCSALTEVTIPNNITSIGTNFLYNCTSLTNVTIPDSVTSIGTTFLRNCTGLDTVIVSSGVTSLGNYVFAGDTDISIYFLGSISSLTSSSFGTGNSSYPYTTGTAYVIDDTSYNTISSAAAVTNRYLTVVDLSEIYEYIQENLVPLIEEAEPLEEVNYTADSWATFEAAYNNAVEFVDDITSYSSYSEDDVDAIIDALTNAINSLVAADNADAIAELEETYEYITALLTVKDESNYTEDSWEALQTAVENAKEALANIESDSSDYQISVLNALTEALTTAYDGLEVDTTSVTEITTKSYDVTDGKIYYGGTTTTLQSITATDDDIAGAISVTFTFDCASDVSYNPYATVHFVVNVNGTEYDVEFTGTDSNYTSGTTGWTETIELTSAIEAGDEITITGYTWAWSDASDYVYDVTQIEYQIETTTASYDSATDDELAAAIAEAQAVLDSLVDGDYTEESVYLLTEIIAEAQAVLDDEDATEAQNAVEIEELAAAIAALEAADNTDALAALAELIETAKGYAEDDYTAETYAVLAAEIEEASAIGSDALNSEIYAAIDELQAAIDALEEASDANTGDGDDNDTDDDTNTDTDDGDDTDTDDDTTTDTDDTDDEDSDSEEDSSSDDSSSSTTSTTTTTTTTTSSTSDDSPDTGAAATAGAAIAVLAALTLVGKKNKK
ncbi:MAG: leucine-rich repeat domain-containing protein [Ruminococcus sp.]|nr:leucine-rich repeat domain-containing protein [Ruminococcus sp.]